MSTAFDTVDIVTRLLRVIAEIVPGIFAAGTGHETDEEAIAAMVERIKELPERGGPGGTDAEDLERRKRGE